MSAIINFLQIFVILACYQKCIGIDLWNSTLPFHLAAVNCKQQGTGIFKNIF